jgi:hypothetical protein
VKGLGNVDRDAWGRQTLLEARAVQLNDAPCNLQKTTTIRKLLGKSKLHLIFENFKTIFFERA